MKALCSLLFVSAYVGGTGDICLSRTPEPFPVLYADQGQSPQIRQVPPDSQFSPSFEHDKPRLNFYVAHLNSYPDAMLHVFVYGGQVVKKGEVEERIKCIRDYLTINKGIDVKRITVRDGGYRSRLTVEIFYGSKGRPEPLPTPTVDPREVRWVKKATNRSKCGSASGRRQSTRGRE